MATAGSCRDACRRDEETGAAFAMRIPKVDRQPHIAEGLAVTPRPAPPFRTNPTLSADEHRCKSVPPEPRLRPRMTGSDPDDRDTLRPCHQTRRRDRGWMGAVPRLRRDAG